jgi:hypothetical protein
MTDLYAGQRRTATMKIPPGRPPMRIRAAAGAASLLTMLTTACSGHGGAAAGSGAPTAQPATPASAAASPPATPPSAAPSPSPSVSATPSGPSVADLTRQVDKATVQVKGAQFSAQDRSGMPPLDVCGGKIAAYALVKAANVWQWLGAGLPLLKESILGFQDVTGADVVTQSRTLAASCRSHDTSTLGEVIRITGSGTLPVATPAGVDGFYAFCETQKVLKPAIAAGVPVYYCTAVMSRDHVAVFLNAGGASASLARSTIVKYVPIAAKALVAGVP